MDLLSLPWVTTRLFAWAMNIIKGDRNSSDNPFHWSQVILNCPGSAIYDTSIPIVYKWNQELGCIDGDCKTFVDNLRYIGTTRKILCVITHQVEYMMRYLGLQEATRNKRPII